MSKSIHRPAVVKRAPGSGTTLPTRSHIGYRVERDRDFLRHAFEIVDAMSFGDARRRPITNLDLPVCILPDQDAQRQIDSRVLLPLHKRRAKHRIAEDDHRRRTLFKAIRFGCRRMVDGCGDHCASLLDFGPNALYGRIKVGRALLTINAAPSAARTT